MEKRICLNQSVLDFMESRLDAQESWVLELGSGWSTAWFAKRCHTIVTVETDSLWIRQVTEDMRSKGLTNYRMVQSFPTSSVYQRQVQSASEFANGYDLVLIDCREDLRLTATRTAWQSLKDSGWLVFDDAQRLRHSESIAWMDGQTTNGKEILKWGPGDIESAIHRLAIAWQK